TLEPGELLVERKRVLAGTATVPVELGEVQAQGKKRMAATDWARGTRIELGERLAWVTTTGAVALGVAAGVGRAATAAADGRASPNAAAGPRPASPARANRPCRTPRGRSPSTCCAP